MGPRGVVVCAWVLEGGGGVRAVSLTMSGKRQTLP